MLNGKQPETGSVGIGAAGVGIGDPGGEELIGGIEGIVAGALQDSRDRSGWIQGLGSGH